MHPKRHHVDASYARAGRHCDGATAGSDNAPRGLAGLHYSKSGATFRRMPEASWHRLNLGSPSG